MTKSAANLSSIFASNSVEAARNHLRALKADKEGRPDEARLFRALANGQQVHANKALLLLRGLIGDTDANLEAAESTLTTNAENLQGMIMTAATERESAIESSFIHFMKATMSHTTFVGRTDRSTSPYHVCQICGYMVADTVPERCPVCRAVPEQFELVE